MERGIFDCIYSDIYLDPPPRMLSFVTQHVTLELACLYSCFFTKSPSSKLLSQGFKKKFCFELLFIFVRRVATHTQKRSCVHIENFDKNENMVNLGHKVE